MRRLSLGTNGGYVLVGPSWLFWQLPSSDLDVRVRVERTTDGWKVKALCIEAAEGKSAVVATDLRELPLGLLTAGLRVPDYHQALTQVTTADDGPWLAPGVASHDEAKQWLRQAKEVPLPSTLRVNVPPGRSYPDEFYDQVARAYGAALLTEDSPVRALAIVNGVAETAVNRWLKEHRLRERRRAQLKG